MYSRKDPSQSRQAAGLSSAGSANRRSATAAVTPSAGAATASRARLKGLETSPPSATATRSRISSVHHHQRGSEPLQMYYGVLHEFSGLSQDMQSSVIIAPASVPMDSVEMDAAVAGGGQSSSPFRRRQAIPNPLKSNERLSIGTSRPASMIGAAVPGLSYSAEGAEDAEKAESATKAANADADAAAVSPSEQATASIAASKSLAGSKLSNKQHSLQEDCENNSRWQDGLQKQAAGQSINQDDDREQDKDKDKDDHPIEQSENGQSIATLQQAFSGLFIDSQQERRSALPGLAAALAPSTPSAPSAAAPVPAPRPHVRSAAAGLDADLERSLPQPVSISYLPSESTRYATRQQKQQQQHQQRQRHQLVRRENEDLDMRMNDGEMLSGSNAV
ncbi:hypothetical protein J3B02_005649, partial [Coemansia erecta]